MEALIMTAQLLLGLSILVGLHELGHLLAAKMFGMRVEQYSIGFPPKIFSFQYGETEYSIGAIPLGGYVKISGMIDESLDTKTMKEEPKPWEFRSKPAWQRLIVMMGGIIVNVITGIVIYIALTFSQGDVYVSKDEFNKYGIVAYELGQEVGLQTGDKIILVNGKDFERYDDVRSAEVLLGNESSYTVDRNGEVIEIPLPNDLIDRLSDKEAASQFIDPRIPFEVGMVHKGTPAEAGGLKEGDKIIQVNDQPIQFFDELKGFLDTHKGEAITAKVVRQENDQPVEKTLDFNVGEDGVLGFNRVALLEVSKLKYSFGESVALGTKRAFLVVWINIQGFAKIIRGDVSASKSLSGPIGIAQIFGGTWDWVRFWRITGLLSMVLAFMNFLPIPALDGGHVAFLTYEIVSGRKPSDRFLENAQKVGMVLLIGIMGFAIFNDIFKWLF